MDDLKQISKETHLCIRVSEQRSFRQRLRLAIAQYQQTYRDDPEVVVISPFEDGLSVARAPEAKGMMIVVGESLKLSSFCFKRPQPLPAKVQIERPEDV
jgi:hypothetical protein